MRNLIKAGLVALVLCLATPAAGPFEDGADAATTTAEAGFPAWVADNSYALFALAGTPTPILTRLHDATVAALALPEVHDQLREQGAEVIGGSRAELAAYVAAEIPKWAALARQAGVQPQ
jgi:tripartite-type tricarboxylate transporter receptor subunit TctC